MGREQEMLQMSQKEINRLGIIEKAIQREISQREAAEIVRLSQRQIRRLVKRVRKQGARGLAHRLRGHSSSWKIPVKQKEKILGIYREKYEGFGPTLAVEKLWECDGIAISDETLRKWLIAEGLWKIQKGRCRGHRHWRERKERFGQMVQMDGSEHDWLEGRGPELTLMGYIDDATNTVYGKFYLYEGTVPALGSLKGYIQEKGIPASIYVDWHATYKTRDKRRYDIDPWDPRNQRKSQFARACRELGITVIYANSPQAKGRVERLFRTLQDRLIKELRLAGASTVEQANEVLARFLVGFNKRFQVKAKKQGDVHRTIPKTINLDDILCIRNERCVRNDYTIMYEKKWYQILARTKAKKVTVREHVDGRITLACRGQMLAYKVLPARPERVYKPVVKTRVRKTNIPGADHPWRFFKLSKSLSDKKLKKAA